MKNKYKHIKKKSNKLTFMFIPNTTGRIKQFSISNKLIIVFVLIVIITTSILTFFTTRYYYTNQNYNKLNKEFIILKNENIAQRTKITYFTSKSKEIDKRIAKLIELENDISKAINPNSIKKESNNPVSRSSDRDLYGPELDEVDIRFVDELLITQQSNIDVLFDDIHNKITVLEKIPNIFPAQGRLTSPFGDRVHPVTKRTEFHSGIDIANNKGTDIVASGTGVVIFSKENGTYGNMIIISHGNEYSTVYAHLSKQLVKIGDKVNKGDIIGKMGNTGRSTGPHLHFEIRKNGTAINPKTILID